MNLFLSLFFFGFGTIILLLTIRAAIVRRKLDSLFVKGLLAALLNFAIPFLLGLFSQ